MTKKTFDLLVKDKFGFLEKEYGCIMTLNNRESWGYEIQYKNSTTGISIVYEFRENYIQIMLYKLINGKIIENTASAIRNNELINGFSLDYIIDSKHPNDLMKPGYAYGEKSEYDGERGWELYISKFASNLKKYGKDVLNGDFSIFTQLDAIVKKRAKDREKQK